MKQTFLGLLFLAAFNIDGFSQYHFKALIIDKETHEPLPGSSAVVKGTTKGAIADMNGFIILKDLPPGRQTIEFSFVGYESYAQSYVFPLAKSDTLTIYLVPITFEMEEVVISTTRSTRTIQEIPTRLEYIATEEIEEKANMRAGDIRMLLSESTGIQMQQTSATSANASIRIQGLDGRYTQLLKDGFPVYAGAASGLGLLQTPPLDLKQVEVVKGSASTLYGGGAIAGLVNLISKTPTEQRDLRFLLNGSSGKGIDFSTYYGQRFSKIGTTLFVSYNRNEAYDPAGIDLSAIPKFDRYVLNPKLFIYFNDQTQLSFGVNTTLEKRIGGDMHYIQGKGDSIHSYFEKNNTQRYATQLMFDHKFDDQNIIHLKNSIHFFNRTINVPDYRFEGIQIGSFSEINYTHTGEKSEWITGINLWTDQFRENNIDTFPRRNYNQVVTGIFVQHSWKASRKINLETGLRTDYDLDYGVILLPRLSVLFKLTDKLTSRLGGGFGYKAPNIFTEESERIHYRNILPVNRHINRLERSYGGNFDINYRTLIGTQLLFNINQLFFYTYLDHPLMLQPQAGIRYQFINANGHIDTRGTETNIKFRFHDFSLFLGYTFTDARLHDNGNTINNPLTPRHRINSVLIYEQEDKWKAGIEAYYYSRQNLTDGSTGRSYVLAGLMAERISEKFSIYINFENILDVRQTRFGSIYTGSITQPVFKDIYAPLDGFLINGGIKFKL